MNRENKGGAAVSTAAGGEAGGASTKEVIFSLIRKIENGVTDGRQELWAWFNDIPNVAAIRNSEGYIVLMWRDGVVIKIFLDNNFNIVGFNVEGP
jgi:hypothetical protein